MTAEHYSRTELVTELVEERRQVAAQVLLGSLPLTDAQSALLRLHFPAFAALSETDRQAVRDAYRAALGHVDGTRAGACRVVAEVKAIGTWWGFRAELLRLAGDAINYVQGADR